MPVLTSAPLPSRTVRTWSSAAWLALFTLSALAIYGRDAHWQTDIVGQLPSSPDVFSFVWFLAWWPWALSHGLDPLHTRLVWFPSGFPLTWTTSVPTASLLALPVTLCANAVAAYDGLTVTAPALSSWTAYLLSRRVTRDETASAIGGGLFGFSSYESGQLQGHLNLDLTALVPVVVLLCQMRLVGDLTRRRFIPLLAIAFTLQFGLSAEVTASLVTLGLSAIIISAIVAGHAWSGKLLSLSVDIGIAGLAALAVVLPWLMAMWRGAADITGFTNPPSIYSTDLLNLIVPTRLNWLGHRLSLADHMTGNIGEQDAYLGPVILILAAAWHDRWRHRPTRALLLGTLVIVIASLGPVLWIAGHDTGIGLPWRLANNLPIMPGLLPCRFMCFASLGAGLIVATWIAASTTRRQRRLRLSAAALSLVFVFPDPAIAYWAKTPMLPFFDQPNVDATIGRGRNILLLPFGTNGPEMFWQWQSGFAFSQTGGATSFIPRAFQTSVVLALQTGRTSFSFDNELRDLCEQDRVASIVIGPGTDPHLLSAIERLGWPRRTEGQVVVMQNPLP